MERVFLGWERPALAVAVDYLVDRYASDGCLDLRHVVIATPGARAGRRFEELLIRRAEQIDPAWYPPTLVTAGRIAEYLYEAKLPFADEMTQQLAWVEAFRKVEPGIVARIVPQLPGADDLGGWLALASILAKLHRELSAEALDFQQVATCGEQLPGFREKDRWLALATVQEAYLATLDALSLWDLQTARLFAIRHGLCETSRDVILLGTADLNQAQRLMLDQIADRVTSLVFAPAEESARFDEHGCLRCSAWLTRSIAIDDARIVQSGGPTDQADEVVRWLVSLGGRYAASQMTIGVPDAEVIPFLERRLAECRIACRYGVGAPMTRTTPYSALAAVAEYVDSRRFSAFAALVRHPVVARHVQSPSLADVEWLSVLDRYQNNHLPARMDAGLVDGDGRAAPLRAVYHAVEQLLTPLRQPAVRQLSQWAEPLASLVIDLFGKDPLDPRRDEDRPVLQACDAIRDVLRQLVSLPEPLTPATSAAEAIRLVLRLLQGETVAAPPDPEAIELLGWLELALDDAPALLVTSFNEGLLPATVNADQFLPNQLRHALGIEDNDRRYARDAYALSMILASREEVRLVLGRRTAVGDPLLPSRLLFACDTQRMAARARRLFDEAAPTPRLTISTTAAPRPATPRFDVPMPRPLDAPVQAMRVTEFRDYLACPYRYYLRHRLRLETLGDRMLELDGAAFGSLAHEVLSAFGKSEAAELTDAERIRHWFDSELGRHSQRRFGKHLPPVVAIQIEQLRARLHALADWQAAWASQGWRILCVEVTPPPETAFLEVDGRKMELRGRIDRIDVNRETGEHIVLDYKTSDTAQPPAKTHRKRSGEWIDLQLPLYRHLLTAMDLPDAVRLGYIVLPKDRKKVGSLLADWDDDALADADETARRVAREVWEERFWPPAETPPPFSEVFAAICQDHRFGRPSPVEEEPEELEES